MDLFSVKQQVYVPTGSGRRKSICVRLRDTGQVELGPGPCTKSLPCGVPVMRLKFLPLDVRHLEIIIL